MFSLRHKLLAATSLSLVLCLAALGCEPIGRARECRRLARAVNAALDKVELEIKPPQPLKLRRAAKHYDDLAHELAAMGFHKEQTAKDVAEYRQMFLDTARALRQYADAADKPDKLAQRRAYYEVERHARREKLSLMKIDGHCTSHR